MNNSVGILPSAGQGKRMLPYNGPKELLSVGYQRVQVDKETKLIPMVVSQYSINAMREAGIRNIYFILSPYKWEIMRFFMSGLQWGMHFGYLCQDEPNGMPGAIDSAYPWIKDKIALMGMPDTIVTPLDCFTQLLAMHLEKKADLSLGIFPSDHPQFHAPVHIDPVSGHILEIFDKPAVPMYHNTWGIAVWSPVFTELLHEYVCQASREAKEQELLLSNVFSKALDQGLQVYGKVFQEGKYYDIGTPETLRETRLLLEYQKR